MVERLDHLRAELMDIVVACRRHIRGAGKAVVVGCVAAIVGCSAFGASDRQTDEASADSAARARDDAANRASPGYIIDSILPVEEELSRFRDAIGGTPARALSGASESRDALVARAIRGLLAADTADLAAMTLSAREFADLVYPESRYTQPPLRQAPGLAWSLIQTPSRSGLRRAVERVGGLSLRLAGYSCDVTPDREGRNLVWSGCAVALSDASGQTESHRLFGSIIEREGMFKIVSWAGEF